MGHTASKPEPGVSLQVLGCGLSRTGTSSFTQALEILIGSPIYHAGSHLAEPNEQHMLDYMDAYRYTPIKNKGDDKAVRSALKRLLDGYRGATDGIVCDFVGEIHELYPEAAIICTVRDPENWWQSMKPVADATDAKTFWDRAFVAVALALLPGLRHWNEMGDLAMQGRFSEKYTARRGQAWHQGSYQEHIDYLERSVPKEKIHYYDVKDGWGPLCKILNKPIPDVPFPRSNDAKATDATIKKVFAKAFRRWAIVVATPIAIGLAWRHIK